MRPVKYYSLLISLICLINCPNNAQVRPIGSPAVTNFSRSDYQAGTQNWTIWQNERGIIYFGNNKGLLEFDGTEWQIYPLPNQTIVRSIAHGPTGRLYLGGQDELGYLQANPQGKYEFTSLSPLIQESLQSFEDIWKIFVEGEKVFFCSEKAVFQLEAGAIKVIEPVGNRFENFFSLDGTIYLQDQEKGLFVLKNDRLQPLPDGEIFGGQRIVAMLPFRQDQLLLFTFSNGLFLMDDTGIRPWQTASSDFLSTYQAYCAIALADGRYAIGTAQNGLIIIDQQGNPVLHLNKNKGLQNNTILSICQDMQRNLWLGLDNGIDLAEINSPFSIIHSEHGIEGTGYASIIHQDKLYLGTNQGLYYTDWQRAGNQMVVEKFKALPNAIGQVWSINKLGQDLLIGQHKGAAYLDQQRIIPFSSIQGAWKFMPLEAHPGYAIEGTYTGLVIYKNQNPGDTPANWELVQELAGFSESARILEEDEAGFIWVSHAYKGLFKIKLSDDLKSIEAIKSYGAKDGLPTDLYINVAKIRQELVFTTSQGVYRYAADQDRFVKHEDFTKMFGENRNVHRLIEDELGNIWFSIDKEFGVLKVNERGVFNDFELVYFNQIHEALVDGFEHVYAFDQENVFIGTETGFIHYNPLQDHSTEFSFKVLLRKVISITSGDSTVYWGSKETDFSLDPPKFHNTMNDFRFTFSAPYFEKIDYVQYRYMLEGFEDNWSAWAPKTEKEYTNLPYGDYRFRIEARNAYGQISAEEIYPFSISLPWYYSWYAQFTYIILALISLIGLVKYISRREKQKTEAFKVEQTLKLELKEAEFKKEVEKSEAEIIKLRNDKLQTDVNHKNSQLAASTMHLVQKSEILMKVKNDLNSLSKEAGPGIKQKVEQISKMIEADIRLDNNWEQFEFYFDQVHENFFKRLRQQFPDLTPKDQKLCAYLRMNLSTKEIAPLLNISVRGVEISRYRLRKKLALDSETNLVSFILDI